VNTLTDVRTWAYPTRTKQTGIKSQQLLRVKHSTMWCSKCLWLFLWSFGNKGNHREKRRIYVDCTVTVYVLCIPQRRNVAENQWGAVTLKTKGFQPVIQMCGREMMAERRQKDSNQRKLLIVITALCPVACIPVIFTHNDTYIDWGTL